MKGGLIVKYLRQFGIILFISFLGELLNYLIPLPIPTSIYGLFIMFICLCLKWIRLESVKETASFLIEIMPLMFIPAAVGLIDIWDLIRSNILAYGVIILVSTLLVMFVSGHVTGLFLSKTKKEKK